MPIKPNEYRKKVYNDKGFEITVPSGSVFRVKRISPLDMIRTGMADLPNDLLVDTNEKMTEKEKAVFAKKKQEKIAESDNKLIETLITEGILEPKVEIVYDKEKDNGEILFWSEIVIRDQEAIMKAVMGGVGESKN